MKKQISLLILLGTVWSYAGAVVPEPVKQSVGNREAPLKEVTTRIQPKWGAEQYRLRISKGKVQITGGSDAGVFWGTQTLRQLQAQYPDALPDMEIEDRPQFAYRGMMLDCCRHFWSVDEIKQLLDMMALHKLNVFHWHLTDDQGWRFESKKYPRLQEVSAWREGTLVGHYREKPQLYDNVRYGGYYTQEQMKEVVSYAAQRHIQVIPEIEMPGHSVAALSAYPELGCTGGPYQVRKTWGISKDVFCLGNDETIRFLKDILDEVCEVFPSEYIHIGGDEAPHDRWDHCLKCQARMAAEGLNRSRELQGWLVREIESYLAQKGRRLIGWDEVLESGVTPRTTIMSWRGAKGGINAAKQGNDVVMTPSTHLYFDYYQTLDPSYNREPLCIGHNVPLDSTYKFDPYMSLTVEEQQHIKGIQANLWTEYVTDWDRVQEQVLPRMAALAELAWNPAGRTEFDAFTQRIRASLVPLYEQSGWRYAPYSLYTRAQRIVREIHDPASDYVVVICHRGDWRNFPENSLPAIESIIRYGADMMELDLKMTKDSVLVLSHDADVLRCTNFRSVFRSEKNKSPRIKDLTYEEISRLSLCRAHGVVVDTIKMPTLREALLRCKDRICVNVDQGYEFYDEVLAITEELGVTDQILIKGKKSIEEVAAHEAKYTHNMMYMPIVDIQRPKGIELFNSYLDTGVTPLAYEVCWQRNNGDFESACRKIIGQGSKVWINTIWATLCGGDGNDDDAAFQAKDPDTVYGQYLRQGVSLIQTDRPEQLIRYLEKKGRHHLR